MGIVSLRGAFRIILGDEAILIVQNKIASPNEKQSLARNDTFLFIIHDMKNFSGKLVAGDDWLVF